MYQQRSTMENIKGVLRGNFLFKIYKKTLCMFSLVAGLFVSFKKIVIKIEQNKGPI